MPPLSPQRHIRSYSATASGSAPSSRRQSSSIPDELRDEIRIERADRIEQVLDVLEPVAQPV